MPLLPSGLPSEIEGDEDLARFLFSRSQFNSTAVKPAAFLPEPKSVETSVFRHGLDPLHDLWSIGVSAAGERTLYGAAIFKARVVEEAGLNVQSDEPPPRHAAVRGWPWMENDPELQKARQKEAALVLAGSSVRVIR